MRKVFSVEGRERGVASSLLYRSDLIWGLRIHTAVYGCEVMSLLHFKWADGMSHSSFFVLEVGV